MSEINKVVERHLTLAPAEVSAAGDAIQAQNALLIQRQHFSFEQLLPADLAAALELIQEPLPTDPLSAVLTLLCGYSGLLPLGMRVAASHQYSVPCNLFLANVAPSGVAKTAVKQRLIDDPAKELRLHYKLRHQNATERWREACKGVKKDERPPAPKPLFPHLQDYTPEALAIQLELHEADGMGLLIVRDEIAGLLQAVEADSKRGRGTGEAQLLELFDGTGTTSIRVDGGSRHYERSHVSLLGNIQPLKLKELVNGEDSTGKFARFLFNQLPVMPLALRDEDPSEQERHDHDKAQWLLKQCAERFHQLTPTSLELDQPARAHLNRWFHGHQIQAQLPGTASVKAALLGKTSGHALRLAGLFHLTAHLREPEQRLKININTMELATEIVDQLVEETLLFHQHQPTITTVLMERLHSYSWNGGQPKPLRWQEAKQKVCTTQALRDCGAKGFAEVVRQLETSGYGHCNDETPVTYIASKAMAA
ncbi:hypothetical protein SynMEDNS5_01777 [Synechococcus sp. MEDNS5]|uniref:DUF3987 domain-containing protein n=1 Tax=Synechococcus sp. MEDNS5 TaxID=1442554 RepID=UPI00164882B2|nr:DUF3987 domain-containing protein [Synechococcus sp. MEDNS5]QNJ06492.1 hypothetical protein SynMEDNS5_01777 [Synechococcus sp. MEDNS5]